MNCDFVNGSEIFIQEKNSSTKTNLKKGILFHMKNLILNLISLPNFTRKAVYQLMSEVKLAECIDAKDAINKWKSLGYISNNYTDEEYEIANLMAKNIIKKSDKENIQILSCYDKEFPESLKVIPDPPAILYVKGNVNCLNSSSKKVAIIGTRNPSEHGKRISLELGGVFAKNGFDVVSGLALGCDTNAHMGCLNAGGVTIAVMAEGLNYIYPTINARLSEEIIEKNGCLISEYPIGVSAKKWNFIERDRLQAGISNGVILIESSVEGGSMHTLNFAVKSNKPIAAINYPDGMRCDTLNNSGNDYAILDMGAIPFMSGNELKEFVDKIC